MNLQGRSVLVLRPLAQAAALADLLRRRGAEPVVVPAIEIQAAGESPGLDAAIRDAARFHWAVFTSVNGVRILAARAGEIGRPLNWSRTAAIGPATAAALEGRGFAGVWIPSAYTTAALGRELPANAGDEVLLVRAQAAGDDLDRLLAERGVRVRRIDAYRTVQTNHDAIRAALDGGVNAVLLTSASIAQSFAAAAGTTTLPPVCCIGPATADAARRAGLPVDAEADRHTIDGIVAALAALPDPRNGNAP